jgi:putative transposase
MNDPAIHNRHSIRLPGYDYSQAGAYFITICTHNHECLFGDIFVGAGSEPAPTERAQMQLNEYGEIVKNTWEDLVNHVGNIELGEFVIMPNHIHGIIIIAGKVSIGSRFVGAGSEPAPTTTTKHKQHALPEIVRQLKTFSARRINKKRGTPGMPVWQRNYYEHVIRNDKSYDEIACYINNNPMQWEMDQLFVRANP